MHWATNYFSLTGELFATNSRNKRPVTCTIKNTDELNRYEELWQIRVKDLSWEAEAFTHTSRASLSLRGNGYLLIPQENQVRRNICITHEFSALTCNCLYTLGGKKDQAKRKNWCSVISSPFSECPTDKGQNLQQHIWETWFTLEH